jgi:hypothetical protein
MRHIFFGKRQFFVDSRLCVVLMPFQPDFDTIYSFIKKLAQGCGLTCLRADEINSAGRVTDDVWAKINEARFIIADLTTRNPNVFYEVGLAHALSKPVILLTQRNEDVPFNLQNIHYIKYDPAWLPALAPNLFKNIKHLISTFPARWGRDTGRGVQIVALDFPESVSLEEDWFEITLHAKNYGPPTDEGYFSVSFPDGVGDLRVKSVESSDEIETKIGGKGEPWADTTMILKYPIAEGYLYGRVWETNRVYGIRVSVRAHHAGLMWFYVNASCRPEGKGSWLCDPPSEAALDIDQRGEPVYCGVIEVLGVLP